MLEVAPELKQKPIDRYQTELKESRGDEATSDKSHYVNLFRRIYKKAWTTGVSVTWAWFSNREHTMIRYFRFVKFVEKNYFGIT